ncbi:spermidine synthase [Marinobacter lacisalsi]|uniref:Spermidine synthase n=1 Tax=Marinobacter lacisalsi TaxID=475979 RepID=A0ABV8QDY4_9GAMM
MLRPSLSGDVVHHTRDAVGPIMVIDYRRHRVLTFDSVFEQSKVDRRRPWLPVHEYNRAMLLPVAWHRPARAVVLGVGGGTLVGALHHLLPECEIQGVDMRREVVRVARDYFSLPQTDRIHITIAEARGALEDMAEGSADLIMADLYGADRMSPAQSRRHFIDLCYQALSDRGWLAINYHRPPDPEGRLFRQLRQQFGSLFSYTSKTNNTVLLASRQRVPLLSPSDPLLSELETELPIAWRKLMAKLR